jgi:hypothetical protein
MPASASSGRSIEALEPFQPRVREVLVERDLAGPLRARHDPLARLGEERDAGVAAELVIDVVADREREVHELRSRAGDLSPQDRDRRVVVLANRAEELVVALVAAEDRVGQVEEDDRRLGEIGEALVLDPRFATMSPQVAASSTSSV